VVGLGLDRGIGYFEKFTSDVHRTAIEGLETGLVTIGTWCWLQAEQVDLQCTTEAKLTLRLETASVTSQLVLGRPRSAQATLSVTDILRPAFKPRFQAAVTVPNSVVHSFRRLLYHRNIYFGVRVALIVR
jgi:hypothetical protein